MILLAPLVHALLVLAVADRPYGTLSVQTAFHGPKSATNERPAVTLVAQSEHSIGNSAESVEISVRREGATVVRLPAGRYVLRARDSRIWAPDVTVDVFDGANASATVPVWPGRTLRFRIKAPESTLTSSLKLNLRGTPDTDAEILPSLVDCPVVRDIAMCPTPVGRLDIQAWVPGFIPDYLWSFDNRSLPPPPEPIDLPLDRGASVIGFVHDAGEQPATNANVELYSLAGEPLLPRPARDGEVSQSSVASREKFGHSAVRSVTDKRGFFQIREAPAGDYQVLAFGEGGTQVAMQSITIVADREVALPDYLSLEEPSPVQVRIGPPSPPAGERWLIEVVRTSPAYRVARFPADTEGRAYLEHLGRGQYTMSVLSEGHRYASIPMIIDKQAPEPVQISIPLVRVKGKVKVGDKPLRAIVTFGGRRGSRSLTFETNESGEFSGLLPKATARGWIVAIEANDPPISRTMRGVRVEPGPTGEAEVNLVVDGGTIRGRIIDAEGAPVEGTVSVSPTGPSDDLITQIKADATGLFDQKGFRNGRWLVQAQSPKGASDVAVVVVGDAVEADLTLTVKPPREIAGRVVSSPSAYPVPGMSIIALPAAAPMVTAPRLTSDSAGGFVLRFPKGVTAANIVYWSNGYATDFVQQPLVGDSEVVLTASSAAGTLVVSRSSGDLARVARQDIPIIVHRGAALMPEHIVSMRRDQGIDLSRPVMTITNMAPGDYAVCPMDSMAYQLGASPTVTPGVCASGVLQAGGELRLELRSENRDRETASGERTH